MNDSRLRGTAFVIAILTLLATPALLWSQRRTVEPRPATPAPVAPAQPSGDNIVIMPVDEDPPPGGGPTVTTQAWSVDWEIVEWGLTGTNNYTATLSDGVVQSITAQDARGVTTTITRAQMDALGLPMPAVPNFTARPGRAAATTEVLSPQSRGFTQVVPSIYGNSLTVRGTIHL